MILVTSSVLARGDTFHEQLALCLEHVRRSRAEPGCLSLNVHVDCENELRLVFVEKWHDEHALRSHFAATTSRQFMKPLRALAEETGSIQISRQSS